MGSKSQALRLYKSLIRESQKFSSYNFRTYAVRRVQDAFKENKEVTDPEKLARLFEDGKKNLEIIKRQALISRLYSTDKLVIENVSK